MGYQSICSLDLAYHWVRAQYLEQEASDDNSHERLGPRGAVDGLQDVPLGARTGREVASNPANASQADGHERATRRQWATTRVLGE